MPLYVPIGVDFRGEVSSFERRERERMARLTFALRHGTAEQRRAALRLKLLPLPEDPEAVAVPGVAVLDLPRDDHSSHAARTAFDPLAYVAARYGGAPQDAEDGDGARGAQVDFSAFMEVLCPDGTSLLESLPLTPCVARGAEVPPSQPAVAATPLASPRAAVHTRAPSIVAALPSFPLESPGQGPQQLQPVYPSSDSAENTSTLVDRSFNVAASLDAPAQCPVDGAYVDEPILLGSAVASPAGGVVEGTFETPSRDVEEQGTVDAEARQIDNSEDHADEPLPQIFVSGGSFTVAAPRRHRRHRFPALSSCRSASALSRSSQPDSAGRYASSVGNASTARSLGPSGPGSPIDNLTPANDLPVTPPRSPFVVGDKCDLGGRVLFTDRLVKSQCDTALPVMISAFQQYVRATTENSDFAAQPSLRLSPWQEAVAASYTGCDSRLGEEEMNTQRLAPRQRGIPLKCYGTDNEVLLCVRQAEQCVRPTFRRVEPAELYGTSQYVSGAFVHGTRR